MTSVVPFTFENRAGLKLFGIVHKPAEQLRNKPAVILLSPGVKTRVAPHRLYVKMAEQFTDIGFLVFRFDFYGLGDSEGEIDEHYLADLYGSVGVGRYVEDTVDALNWIEKEYKVSKVIFAGLCGGALTGLLTGANDNRVEGLIALGMPIILDSANVNTNQYITQWKAEQLRAGYFNKIFNPKAWLRLLTLKSDYRVIINVLAQRIGKRMDKQTEAAVEKTRLPSNYNSLFTTAFFKMADNSRRILLMFSGADRLWSEFEEIFVANFHEKLKKCKNNFEIQKIENANHILSDQKWVTEMLDHSKRWLQTHYR